MRDTPTFSVPAELGSPLESPRQNSTRPHVTILVLRMLYGAPRLEKGAEGLWFGAWAWGSTLGVDSDAVTY